MLWRSEAAWSLLPWLLAARWLSQMPMVSLAVSHLIPKRRTFFAWSLKENEQDTYLLGDILRSIEILQVHYIHPPPPPTEINSKLLPRPGCSPCGAGQKSVPPIELASILEGAWNISD